jgi:hypothetical protein
MRHPYESRYTSPFSSLPADLDDAFMLVAFKVVLDEVALLKGVLD